MRGGGCLCGAVHVFWKKAKESFKCIGETWRAQGGNDSRDLDTLFFLRLI